MIFYGERYIILGKNKKSGVYMKLTVLVDNNTIIDKNFFGEPGLSFYIEEENTRLLFDVGYSDVFLRNAYKMNIDLKSIDYLVLSHGHLDHTWGLIHLLGSMDYYSSESLKKATLLAHPMALAPKSDNGEQIGMAYSKEILGSCFNLELSKTPVWITERLVFLGEIERTNSFENQNPIGTTLIDGVEKPDFLMDDSAMAYKTDEGIVVITGCSHSGICNIIDYAKKICGDNRVVDIIGGFHLLSPPEIQMNETLNFLKNTAPKVVHTCHCTDLSSKIALAGVVNVSEVGVGGKYCY